MKMTKLFTTVFDEELKSRGFKRKARLYYRLNGDILQGVIIKTVNPYTIHFYSAPYWMENIQADLFPLYKGYWAENGSSIGSALYYREENEQINLDQMNAFLTIAKTHILPVLDRMCDLKSYIENCTPNWQGFDQKMRGQAFIECSPNDVGEEYSHLEFSFHMVWYLWNMYTYSAFLKYACEEENLQNGYDLLDEKSSLMPVQWGCKKTAQKEYMQYMTDDGLTRAKQYFEDRREEMLPRLRDELGLDTFNL